MKLTHSMPGCRQRDPHVYQSRRKAGLPPSNSNRMGFCDYLGHHPSRYESDTMGRRLGCAGGSSVLLLWKFLHLKRHDAARGCGSRLR